jgi:rhodanese-related sulfurtransferase
MEQVNVHDVPALVSSFDEQARPVLLDVREPWEVQSASLAVHGVRTLHIPMSELPSRLGELDPEQPLLSLCHHGVRSLQVAAFLERQGFSQVFNVAGGIDAWSREVDASVPLY